MTLLRFKVACISVSIVALLVFTGAAYAGNSTEHATQDTPRLMAKDQSWSLRLPKDGNVVYKGVVSYDGADTGGPAMMYPAPNVGGFFVAVITHGFINESVKNIKENKVEKRADKVLLPYQNVLSNYHHKELMQRGLEKTSGGGNKKLIDFSEKPSSDWVLESTPVFFMTQGQNAIILENSISIYAPDAPSAAAYRNIVRVVSQVKDGADLANFWTANQGEELKEESANLFAHSLDVALDDVVNGSSKDNNVDKTFRYPEGRTEKMERGRLVAEHCNRLVIRTLRGWLMSIPARRDATVDPVDGQCADASRPAVVGNEQK